MRLALFLTASRHLTDSLELVSFLLRSLFRVSEVAVELVVHMADHTHGADRASCLTAEHPLADSDLPLSLLNTVEQDLRDQLDDLDRRLVVDLPLQVVFHLLEHAIQEVKPALVVFSGPSLIAIVLAQEVLIEVSIVSLELLQIHLV